MVTRGAHNNYKIFAIDFHKDFTMSPLRPQMTEIDSVTPHNPQGATSKPKSTATRHG
jgi:hypothetical protein